MSQAAQSARTLSARAEPAPTSVHHSPPYRWAFLSAIALFALYALTLAPTTAFWDTSEYIATAHILGIPHPPGNPLFVLLARGWELLLSPFGLSVAVRINLFSAFMSAGAAFFWFLLVHRVLAFFSPSEVVRRVGAFAAVWVSGTAFTVWNQSNVNEKVYTVTLFTIALMSWIAFLWRDHVEEHRGQKNRRWHDDNAILLVIFVLALSVGNHLMAFLAAPALLVFLLLVKPASLANWKLYPGMVGVAVLGLCVQLYLPIRANQDPIINEAAPKCESASAAFASVVTMGRAGNDECPALGSALRREQYQKPDWKSQRMASFGNQMANFFQYFDWQWSRSLSGTHGYFGIWRVPFTLVFLLLGIWGAVEHYRKDRTSFWYVGVLFATLSVGLVIYMNFKNGYMQAQALGLQSSEVRERDYFYIITFSVWGLWVGVGLTALWLAAAAALRSTRSVASVVATSAFPAVVIGLAAAGIAARGGASSGTAAGYALGAGGLFLAGWTALGATFLRRERFTFAGASVLAIALVPTATNALYASRAGDYAARDFAYNVLQSVEPYGVLITNGDNDTFPLWYLQEVEGIRRDVTVIVMSYFNTPWYVKQLRDLTRPCPTPGAALEDPTVIVCQRPFDPAGAPRFYGNPRAPTKPILELTDVQIDQMAGSYPVLADDNTFYEARGMRLQAQPGAQLDPAHIFVTLMLQNAWGDRPIYFAATTNTHLDLGLLEHTTRQGLAYKVLMPEETAGLTRMPPDPSVMQFTGGWFSLERNRQLFDEVMSFRNMPDRAVWPDDATRNIPMQYYYAFAAVAQASQFAGDAAGVEKWTARANGFSALANER